MASPYGRLDTIVRVFVKSWKDQNYMDPLLHDRRISMKSAHSMSNIHNLVSLSNSYHPLSGEHEGKGPMLTIRLT